MRMLKSLIVVAAALALPSCAAYMHEGRHAYGPCSAHEGRHEHGPCYAHEGGRRLGVIGISIARAGESRRGPLVVAHVLRDSPAADADIRPGDRIRAIDGESTRGMTIPEAARLIRGPADTAVELRIESPRGPRLVTLVRVPAHAVWPHHGCRHHPCGRDERRYEAAPTEEPPPARDEAPAIEVWPPTKPGHHVP